MGKYGPKVEGHPTWNMHSAELRRALGLPKRLPENQHTYVVGTFQGITFTLLGKCHQRSGGRQHRLYGTCPGCEEQVPAGRFHQHKCKS